MCSRREDLRGRSHPHPCLKSEAMHNGRELLQYGAQSKPRRFFIFHTPLASEVASFCDCVLVRHLSR